MNATVTFESDVIGVPLSDLEIMTVFYSWGNGGMLAEEIAALWHTWEPSESGTLLLRWRCRMILPAIVRVNS